MRPLGALCGTLLYSDTVKGPNERVVEKCPAQGVFIASFSACALRGFLTPILAKFSRSFTAMKTSAGSAASDINRKRRRQQRRGIRFRRELRLYPNIDTGVSRFRRLWTERRAVGWGAWRRAVHDKPRRKFFCLRPRKLRSSRRLLSDEGTRPHGPAQHAREHAYSLSMHVVHALIRTSRLAASRRARGGGRDKGPAPSLIPFGVFSRGLSAAGLLLAGPRLRAKLVKQ